MSKNKTYTVIGTEESCPKCFKDMERREHETIKTKQIAAPFYFREWDYCRPCSHVQFYEHHKVHNNNQAAVDFRRQQADFVERQRQMDFLKSL